MTPEQMRIVIAEKCGWKRELKYELSFTDPKKEIGHEEWKSPTGYWNRNTLDYPNDLNAMHEAEKTLFGHNEWRVYIENLCKIQTEWEVAIHASAIQRAKAFIKTVCPEKMDQ